MPDLAQELADRLAINDVVSRYAEGVDSHDPELLLSSLATDVEIEFAPGLVIHGVEELKEAQASGRLGVQLAGGMTIRETIHGMVNHLIQLDGDRATGQLHVLAFLIGSKDGNDAFKLRGVRHLDEYERRDGNWVITRRKHIIGWVFDGVGTISPM